MATSARYQSLRDQRNIDVRRKVLRPGSLTSSVSNIARKAATDELEARVKAYNAGELGNDEMLTYLQGALSNRYFTQSEKIDIQDKIRNFKVQIQVEGLEAVYKSAQGSDKVEAAKSLAEFYQEYAAQLEPGTPAQSKAIQKAADWTGTMQSEVDKNEKQERKIKRAEEMLLLSVEPPNTVETLQKKYDAFVRLSQEAAADGDQIEATDLATKANKIVNEEVPALEERLDREANTQLKRDLLNAYREVTNNYHDGKLTPQEAAQLVRQIDEKASQVGDTALIQTINSFADRLQTDIEKGTTTGDVEGLPFMKRKTAGGEMATSIKEMKAQFQKEDDLFATGMQQIKNIPDAVQRLNEMLKLYAVYVYGKQPDQDDPDGWIGLSGRKELYSQWAQAFPDNPTKVNEYTNAVRDLERTIYSNQQKLAEVAVQYEAFVGDDENIKAFLDGVRGQLPVDLQVPAGTGREYGVLVGYDKLGRRYEKAVPLNASVSETDASGAQISTDTYVGKNIAKGPDGKYYQLTPHYPDPSNTLYSDFAYTNIDGKYYVIDSTTGEMIAASDLASTRDDVKNWYAGVAQEEATMIDAVQKANEFIGPPGAPEGYDEKARQTILDTAAAREVFKQRLPEVQAQEKTAQELKTQEPTAVPAPVQTFTPPAEANTPRDVAGTRIYLNSVQNDVRVPESTPLQPARSTPTVQQPTYQPAPVQTPSFNLSYGDIKPTQTLTSPVQQPTPLQQSGIRINLDNSYAPTFNPPQPSLLQNVTNTIKTGVNKVKNWLGNLF